MRCTEWSPPGLATIFRRDVGLNSQVFVSYKCERHPNANEYLLGVAYIMDIRVFASHFLAYRHENQDSTATHVCSSRLGLDWFPGRSRQILVVCSIAPCPWEDGTTGALFGHWGTQHLSVSSYGGSSERLGCKVCSRINMLSKRLLAKRVSHFIFPLQVPRFKCVSILCFFRVSLSWQALKLNSSYWCWSDRDRLRCDNAQITRNTVVCLSRYPQAQICLLKPFFLSKINSRSHLNVPHTRRAKGEVPRLQNPTINRERPGNTAIICGTWRGSGRTGCGHEHPTNPTCFCLGGLWCVVLYMSHDCRACLVPSAPHVG